MTEDDQVRLATRPAGRKKDLLLLGSSHMDELAMAMNALGVDFAGGAIMGGNQWTHKLFSRDPDYFFSPYSQEANESWRKAFDDFSEQKINAPGSRKTIITDLGMHTYTHLGEDKGYQQFLQKNYGESDFANLHFTRLNDFLVQERWELVSIVIELVSSGYKVIVVTDPPHYPFKDLLSVIDRIMCLTYEKYGCITFNARHWVDDTGMAIKDFMPDRPKGGTDRNFWWLHAKPNYYAKLAKALLSLC